jgi:hypothetical protein
MRCRAFLLSAVPAAKERNRQKASPGLVGDLKLDIARIGQFVAKLLDRRQGFGLGCIEVGKLDAFLVLIDIVTVPDVEKIAGHGSSFILICGGKKRLRRRQVQPRAFRLVYTFLSRTTVWIRTMDLFFRIPR